ncbi:MAG: hypothetical protein U0359_27295 [Byssovorax sp.]
MAQNLLSLPSDLAERVLASHPLPIADAAAALVAADGPFEQRDRIVEVFRAALRLLAALVLAARIQFGKGPGAEPGQVPELVRSLRSRGLTDGQWFAIVRELTRPFAQAPGSHPLAELVTLLHGKKPELPKLIDELLAMRKSETVAHGASGTKAAIAEILARRAPQLARLLTLLEPIWSKGRLAVPLAIPEDEGASQAAWLLMGDTPSGGKWRRIALSPEVRVPPGEALLLDAEGKPLLALHPLLLVRRPSPEAVEEVFVLDGGSKKGAIFVALPSMAEHRESEVWGALSRALDGDDAATEGPDASGLGRPFRGLSSFGPEHAALFFGREEQAEALANRIRRHPFITVTGPSGSGKTSLLAAGALPILRDHLVALLRPGPAPLDALADRLAELTAPSLDKDEIAEILRRDPASLGPRLAAWSRDASPEGPVSSALGAVFRTAGDITAPRIAVVVDQAEELLTLCHDETARTAFARALASIGGSADAPSRVVLSVREDFFARLSTLGPLRGLASRVVEVVATPDREALARTLFFPAKHFGFAFEDESLLVTMIEAVEKEPAALALLQFCADRLWDVRDRTWKRLTWDAYRAIGGVEGALAAHADGVLKSLSPAQQRACRGLFLRLVTAERTRAASARRELLESAGAPEDAAAVLDRLIAARLVTASEDGEGEGARVEIVHEALIRHWGALAGWLDEDVEAQRLSHALRQAAAEWDSRKRPRGLLWRGDALLDLRRVRKRSTDRLTEVEAAFTAASEAEERRSARIRRALGAGALAATGAFGAFMFVEWRAAESARVETEHQRARAEVRGLVSEARNQEPAGKPGEALALLRAASSLEDAEGERSPTPVSLDLERLGRAGAAARVLGGHAWGLLGAALSPDGKQIATAARDGAAKLWDHATGALVRTLPAGDDPLLSIAYAPDGKTLATTSGTAKADGGLVRFWAVENGTLLRTIKLGSTAYHVAYSPDGKLVAACAEKEGAALYDAASGALVHALGEPKDGASEASFSRDGALVLVRAGKEARLHAVPSGDLVATLTGHERPILAASLSHDGSSVATASSDGTLRIWDAKTGKEKAKLAPSSPGYGKALTFRSLAWAPNDGQLAVGASDGSVRLVDPASAEVRHTLLLHKAQVEALAYSPGGQRLLSTSLDGSAALWEPATGALVEPLRGHKDGVLGGSFTREDEALTFSDDRTARLWNVVDGPFVRLLDGHARGVERLAASGDGSILISGGIDGTARIWESKTGRSIAAITGHKGPVAIAVSPDGSVVLTGSMDTQARLWDGKTGAPRFTLAEDDKGASAVALSPDGKLAATGALDGPVRLWDAASGAPKKALAGHDKRVASLAFSPDSTKLASASWDGTARLFDLRSDAPPKVLKGPEGHVVMAAFSPDGKALAVAADQEVRVFDASTGEPRFTLKGHEQQVNMVAYSPDGTRIATASLDATMRTWAASTGAPQKTFTGHTEAVMDLAFSPDGSRLVSAGDDTVRVWHVETGLLIDTIVAHRTDASLRGTNAVVWLGRGDEVATAAQDGSVTLLRIDPVDRKKALLRTGALMNQRVCRESLKVVAAGPQPAAESVWAEEALCKE